MYPNAGNEIHNATIVENRELKRQEQPLARDIAKLAK